MSNLSQGIISVVRDLLEHETQFFRSAAVMQEPQRSRVLANHSRTTHEILSLLKHIVAPAQTQPRFVVNIPIPRSATESLFEDVLVTPTASQLIQACEHDVESDSTNCAVCQESILIGTRLRNCRHMFHRECIMDWFGRSSRCPVCRDDVRVRLPTDRVQSTSSVAESHSVQD